MLNTERLVDYIAVLCGMPAIQYSAKKHF